MPKYHQDKRNANKGTTRGREALKQSLERLGAGRSVLVDKHNVIIAGNKTMEAAEVIGLAENTIVVETTGDKLVVVKRMDLDLEAKDAKAIEMSLADNRVAQLGLDFDLEILKTDLEMLKSDFLNDLWTPEDFVKIDVIDGDSQDLHDTENSTNWSAMESSQTKRVLIGEIEFGINEDIYKKFLELVETHLLTTKNQRLAAQEVFESAFRNN